MNDHRKILEITNHWRDVAPRPEWQHRANLVAELIPPGSRVLEFGCWDRYLETVLPPDCTYTGADLYHRGPGSLVMDLNWTLPQFPEHDVAVAAGVLEYLKPHRAEALLGNLASRHAIISYGIRPADAPGPPLEFATWSELAKMAGKYGWEVQHVVEYDARQPLRVILDLHR